MALVGTINASNDFGLKNRIINGDMRIDQRNAGASVTLDTNTRFIVDRFFAEDDSSATVTGVQSTTAPAGFINSMLFTVTTADSSITASENCQIRHWIEGLNVADLGWGTANAQTVTLSFWVRSSVTGTHSGALLNSASNRNYVFSYTINSANTFEYKTITIAGDTSGTWLTTNGRGIGLFWNLGSGSTFLGTAGVWGSSVLFGATGSVQLFSTLNATFYITGVQLEKGSTATSFDYRPYGTELALCQRYFEKSYDMGIVPGTSTDNCIGGQGIAIATNYTLSNTYYKVPKRISGNTVTIYAYDGTSGSISSFNGTGNMGATGVTSLKVGETGFAGVIKSGGTNFTINSYYWWQWTSSAEL